jgi:acid phosphatase
MRVRLDPDGKLTKRVDSPSAKDGTVKVISAGGGQVTPDGYSVNTSQPPYQPSGVSPAPDGNPDFANPVVNAQGQQVVPPQTQKTIGDTLTAKNISWTWYAGGFNLGLADGRQAPTEKRKVIYSGDEGGLYFIPHHQPFNYHARFAPGTSDRAEHLKDGDDFVRDIDAGTLPQVAFYKPVGRFTQHPSYTDLVSGDDHIADLLERLKRSPQWNDMAVIVTYDENGGFWDHVGPPKGDRWGPGSRIPALVISPYAKKGFVDHTQYDTTSILRLITHRFSLPTLPGLAARDAALVANGGKPMGDLTNALDFSQ